MLKIGLIVGSTRPNRFADVAKDWIIAAAEQRSDLELELLDLRDQNLPFFEEPRMPSQHAGVFLSREAEAWRGKLGRLDGFIATVAEYNHGPTAVLKNAFDNALFEWGRKPIAFVGYGGTGGVRAIEHLRGVAIALNMAAIRSEVNIAMDTLVGLRDGRALHDYPYLIQSLDSLLTDVVWWGHALQHARLGGQITNVAAKPS